MSAANSSGPTARRLPETFTAPSHLHTTPPRPLSANKDEPATRQPTDPDPFLSVDMENLRNRRRNSLAPPAPPQSEPGSTGSSGISCIKPQPVDRGPPKLFAFAPPSAPADDEARGPFKKARTLARRPHSNVLDRPDLPDDALVAIFQYLDIRELVLAAGVSSRWRRLATTSPKLCTHVDLNPLNRRINDWSVTNILAPFIGPRPVEIDIGNCFHITDEGFQALWRTCGRKVKSWRMQSVWDVSANQILDMSENAKELEEVNWSNCRKVGDNLLARVVGWVVPEPPPPPPPQGGAKNVVTAGSAAAKARGAKAQQQQQQQREPPPQQQQRPGPPPGTVIGCPKLHSLDLSYCKHITGPLHGAPRGARVDQDTVALAHALHVHHGRRLPVMGSLPLQQPHEPAARRLHLPLGQRIVALVNAAKNLTHLDLSFCCALSDTATEVVALGLPLLRELRLAFCGSAVSDASLGCIALHLIDLKGLSVRGCVRVTGVGVENVLEGCVRLDWLDVSQCKNLTGWLAGGGVSRWGHDGRGPGSAPSRARPATTHGAGPAGTGPILGPVIPPRGARRRAKRTGEICGGEGG